jgi:hypothetical protein
LNDIAYALLSTSVFRIGVIIVHFSEKTTTFQLLAVFYKADLLNLKVVGDPEPEVAEDEEGDDLPARLLPSPAFLVDLLLLQVRDEEKLEVHLNP